MNNLVGMEILQSIKGLPHHKCSIFLVGTWLFTKKLQHVLGFNPTTGTAIMLINDDYYVKFYSFITLVTRGLTSFPCHVFCQASGDQVMHLCNWSSFPFTVSLFLFLFISLFSSHSFISSFIFLHL